MSGEETLYCNGVDLETGGYATTTPRDLAVLARAFRSSVIPNSPKRLP